MGNADTGDAPIGAMKLIGPLKMTKVKLWHVYGCLWHVYGCLRHASDMPQTCPRHASDDAPDMPQMMPQTCPRWCPRHAPDICPITPQKVKIAQFWNFVGVIGPILTQHIGLADHLGHFVFLGGPFRPFVRGVLFTSLHLSCCRSF